MQVRQRNNHEISQNVGMASNAFDWTIESIAITITI